MRASAAAKFFVHHTGKRAVYEGCHAELVAAGILRPDDHVPKNRWTTVRGGGAVTKVTMLANGKLRVRAPAAGVASTDTDFQRFMLRIGNQRV